MSSELIDDTLQEKGDDIIFPPPFAEDLEIYKTEKTRKISHKNGEILSIQFGLNIFIVGIILILACSLKMQGVTKSDLLIFLIVLMLIQMFWMLWYVVISDSKKWGNKEKDSHAGARWLRCGIALFALTTLAMDALKLGYFTGYSACMNVTEAIYPATHIIHTVFQVYFLWYHSKDVIQSFKSFERFGLIHSVFTNLLLWATAVATESQHQLQEHMGRLSTLGFKNITLDENHHECNCTSELCDSFSKGIYYIYPFNIEYHILASTMLFVLWKNIGNKITYHRHNNKLKFQGVFLGAILGLIVLTATIGVLVTYLFKMGSSKVNSEEALSIYYWYSIIILGIMCIFSIIGLILYKLENKSIDQEKSPAIKLDKDLLVGTACSSWFISWGSILAIIFSTSHPDYTWYNLPYSILVIIEKYFQNLFIIKYICSSDMPSNYNECAISKTYPTPDETIMPPDIMSIDNYQLSIPKNGFADDPDFVNNEKQETYSTGYPISSVPNKDESSTKCSIKKIILRNITVVLFICNISLWLPSAFGCRPQYDNGLEATIFGFLPWIIVIDIALPFSIFYRMHSAYSLFDVYCKI